LFELKRRIYESAPAWLKAPVKLIPFGWLAGSSYRRTLSNAAWLDRAKTDEIAAYVEAEIGKTLAYATRHVPAYRPYQAFVQRLKPMEALKAFPLICKETVQDNFASYLSDEIDTIPFYKTTTGGSSGRQLTVYLEDDSQSVETAFMHRQWARVGYAPSERKATFRGVRFFSAQHEALWQENPIYNECQFSVFHMSEDRLHSYVDKIFRYRPTFLHGYPSAIDTLAEYVNRHGLTHSLGFLRAVLLGSEGATLLQRDRIESAFNARVFSWYGHSERLVLAGECEHSTSYHQIPDYGFAELVSESGDVLLEDGSRGELVGTSMHNRVMPLIRYRTEDLATLRTLPCECGRAWMRFSDVEGRWKQEALISRRNAAITLAAINMHGSLFDHVVRFQYVQDTPGECTIRLVPTRNFTDADADLIIQKHHEKVRDELHFRIQRVEEIPLTLRGKLKRLVQNIPVEHVAAAENLGNRRIMPESMSSGRPGTEALPKR
jgi:phenylacetate-CoA ligase